MALPKQVQRQQAELDDFEKALQARAAAAVQTPEPSNDPPAVSAVPQTPVASPVPVQAAPAPAPAPEPNVWEQRYVTLQAKYDAEVPRLHAHVKQLTEQMQTLTAQLQRAAQAPAQPAAPATPAVTAADEEAFGAPLIDLQRRIAREQFASVVAPLQEQIKQLEERNKQLETQVGQANAAVGQTSFEVRLRQLVPDFDTINSDPKWVEWLNATDPLTGAPRGAVAQDLFNRGDAEGVARVVKLYQQESTPAQPAAPAADPRQAELNRQVAPTRTQAPAQPANPKGRTYTAAEAQRAFDEVRRLNIAGRYEEASKKEAEISLAFVEGRVSPA